MPDFQKNNLTRANSPYLQQHAENPVHWQEWTDDALAFAKKEKKLVLVSIGYATCHWCHVMAKEAFSEPETAKMLNEHFVSIKVDREERPDIDQHFIDYVARTTGSAGWPLNVILSPNGKPLFGGTYFPAEPGNGLPAFKDLLTQLVQWYDAHGADISEETPLAIERSSPAANTSIDRLVAAIVKAFDAIHGGFGNDAKFPPHSTLLFLLAAQEAGDKEAGRMAKHTLDAMALRGLHDHLQGGFYRYCTDNAWTIPHFEKMLYDQAMHLWTYSLASRILKESAYAKVAEGILGCLEETFRDGDLYVSAHDADTDHEEGATYLWTPKELQSILSKPEYRTFEKTYDVTLEYAIEGHLHLIRKSNGDIQEIEKKLLAIRKKRTQPFTDRKIVTSWNALLGIAFVMHWRATGTKASLEKAVRLCTALKATHWHKHSLAHSSLAGKLQAHGFLQDYAALLALVTLLYEDTWDEEYRTFAQELLVKLQTFRAGESWHENEATTDFLRVEAQSYDQPLPSSISLAQFALWRAEYALDAAEPRATKGYAQPLESDYANLVTLLQSGHAHAIHAPQRIDWKHLSPFSIQLPGTHYEDCTGMQCTRFASEEKLLDSLKA